MKRNAAVVDERNKIYCCCQAVWMNTVYFSYALWSDLP